MSSGSNYRRILGSKLRDALSGLATGDLLKVEKQRLEESILDSAMEPCESSDSFVEVLAELIEGDEEDSGVLMAKECQLQLLRAFLALERRDDASFMASLRDLLLYSCLYLEEGDCDFTSIAKSAEAAMVHDPFQQARILLLAARHCFNKGRYSDASDLCARVNPDSTGPLRALYDGLRTQLK